MRKTLDFAVLQISNAVTWTAVLFDHVLQAPSFTFIYHKLRMPD